MIYLIDIVVLKGMRISKDQQKDQHFCRLGVDLGGFGVLSDRILNTAIAKVKTKQKMLTFRIDIEESGD
jgi:hypothetical protein